MPLQPEQNVPPSPDRLDDLEGLAAQENFPQGQKGVRIKIRGAPLDSHPHHALEAVNSLHPAQRHQAAWGLSFAIQ
jgi:hypothetical protein